MNIQNISVSFRAKAIVILLLNSIFSGSSYANSLEASKVRESYIIGKSGLNRITMLPHKIVSVAGDNSQYKLQSDKDGSSIYIMPIAKPNQKIELSVRSDVGQIKDLQLKVVSGHGRTIKLNNPKKLDNLQEQKAEIKRMISSMQKKEKGDYRVRKLNRNIANNYKLKITQKASYQYKDLRGAVLEVKPTRLYGKSIIFPSDLNEEMFAKLFSKPLATSIKNDSSDKAVLVFIVTSLKDRHGEKNVR